LERAGAKVEGERDERIELTIVECRFYQTQHRSFRHLDVGPKNRRPSVPVDPIHESGALVILDHMPVADRR